MKYKYTIKIHTVIDYNELETILNKYGSEGIRATKIEDLGSVFLNGRPMRKYVLYLEENIKKS
jgi:hypothetical protein